MRTKQVEISKEEQDFQKNLNAVVNGYEERIKRMIGVRNVLRKYRKCLYCGGKYYAHGLCVNCYNVMRRANGDIEEFKRLRTRYGYRVNKSDNWRKTFFTASIGEDATVPDMEVLKDWCDRVAACLSDDDRKVLKLMYEEGWSIRGCANQMKRERGWIMSRAVSIKNIAKKIWENIYVKNNEEDSEK